MIKYTKLASKISKINPSGRILALKIQRKRFKEEEVYDKEEKNVIEELKGCTSPFISKVFLCNTFIYEESAEAAAIEPFWEVKELDFDKKYNKKNVFIGIGMEFIDGYALDYIGLNYSIPELFKYIIQVAAGLEWLHKKGIMHRDIKPANIMITEDGSKVIS